MARGKDYTLQPGQLWPNTPSGSAIEIEVFGATGEYQSGKTLLGLSIAPGVHPDGHKFAGQPRTRYYDFEKSGGTYGGTGCERISVPDALLSAGIEYTPINVFTWTFGDIRKIGPGRFDVIMLDPGNDVEGGMVDYVKRNVDKFGLTKAQAEKGGGLLWGAVKDFWKQQLLILSVRCKCFFFTTHLRDSWTGTTPNGKREPKGKETLMELTSVYLWLDRLPDKDGTVSDVPSATVLKQRLADTRVGDHGGLEIVPLLPPRLPEATVAAIRGYIANPPDYHKLKAGEKAVEKQTSDEEKLRLQLATAEADRDSHANHLQVLARQAELRAMQMQTAADKPQTSDQTAATQKAKAEAAQTKAEAERLKAQAEAELLAAKETEAKLLAGTPADHRMAGGGNGTAATNPPDAAPRDPALATRSQAMEVVSLCRELGIDAVKLKAICQKAGSETVSGLKREVCQVLIEKLQAKKANGRQPVAAGTPGN